MLSNFWAWETTILLLPKEAAAFLGSNRIVVRGPNCMNRMPLWAAKLWIFTKHGLYWAYICIAQLWKAVFGPASTLGLGDDVKTFPNGVHRISIDLSFHWNGAYKYYHLSHNRSTLPLGIYKYFNDKLCYTVNSTMFENDRKKFRHGSCWEGRELTVVSRTSFNHKTWTCQGW